MHKINMWNKKEIDIDDVFMFIVAADIVND